ncbi:MAG: hypothetical protein GY795_24330 [Desulfobacterales bacterium]|nr:hypothetical protein [Desulfobacterales bacterium]
MKKYSCLLSILLFFFSVPAYAEPSLLWKKEFDSRIVKTTRLTNFQLKKGKGGDFPLKAVMTEKSIFVLDHKGKIEKRISLEDYDKAVMSDHGIIAAMKGKTISISDLDNQVKGVVKIRDSQPMVLPQHISFEISPDGKFIAVLSSFTNMLYFHNDNGKLVSEYKFEDLRGAKIKFSGDSQYAAVHMPNWGQGKTGGFLVLFNDKGEKLWKFDHKGCEAAFDISGDGASVALAANDRLYSLDSKKNVVYEKESEPGETRVRLSVGGQYLAIARKNRHRIDLLDNRNGNILWTENISGFDPVNSPISSLDVSEQGQRTVVAISKNWTKQNKETYLFLFEKSGIMVWKHKLEEPVIQCSISPDGKCVFIFSNREGYLFRI